MQKRKLSFGESLEKDVVSTYRCVGCAACVVVCPFKCLEYAGGEPRLVKECEVCGICPEVCPKYDWSMPGAEEFVFGRKRRENEDFGVCRRMVVAQASDEKILKSCQDGGVASALLTCALQEGLIEGAAISSASDDKPLYPIPKLATTAREILESAGTRYSYSPNMLAFQEGVNQKKRALAFVGTPCQIHAIRKIQMFPLKKYSNPLRLTIGLMCTESFSYDGLFNGHLQRDMGVDLANIQKINIKGKIIVTLKSGDTKTVALSEAKQYARASCNLCNDFSAELADISTGGLGLDGWTFVILRTEEGEKIFDAALKHRALKTRDASEEPFAQKLLTKLSRKKRRNTSAS